MGAFAIENMRTAFERGAAHVTLLCRQRGTVCPQLVDWVNFIRPWEGHSHSPRHAAAGDAEVLQAWRAAYDVSGAVRPECWQQEFFEVESCIQYCTTRRRQMYISIKRELILHIGRRRCIWA